MEYEIAEIKRLNDEVECHNSAYKELVNDALDIAMKNAAIIEKVDIVANDVWIDMMDYCKKKSIAPSNFELFNIIAKIRSISK